MGSLLSPQAAAEPEMPAQLPQDTPHQPWLAAPLQHKSQFKISSQGSNAWDLPWSEPPVHSPPHRSSFGLRRWCIVAEMGRGDEAVFAHAVAASGQAASGQGVIGDKLVGHSAFKRHNPMSDRFQVHRFAHVEFWTAEATMTWKR